MEKIKIKVKYADNKITDGYVLDVSKNGMGIATLVGIDKNTEIEIIAEEPLAISLKGKVATIAERKDTLYLHRLGVKFISCDEASKQALIDFIVKRERRNLGRLVL